MLEKKKIEAFYSGIIEELRGVLGYVYFAIAVYAAGLLLGLVFPGRLDIFLDSFRKLAGRFAGRSVPVLILMIFLQNVLAAFVAMWAGALLGLVPLAAAAINGVLLGVVMSAAQGSFLLVICKLIPHGIFEMPAVFISWGLGIWRGAWLFRRSGEGSFRERARSAYRIFFGIVLPLLFIAAIVEGLGIWYWRGP